MHADHFATCQRGSAYVSPATGYAGLNNLFYKRGCDCSNFLGRWFVVGVEVAIGIGVGFLPVPVPIIQVTDQLLIYLVASLSVMTVGSVTRIQYPQPRSCRIRSQIDLKESGGRE